MSMLHKQRKTKFHYKTLERACCRPRGPTSLEPGFMQLSDPIREISSRSGWLIEKLTTGFDDEYLSVDCLTTKGASMTYHFPKAQGPLRNMGVEYSRSQRFGTTGAKQCLLDVTAAHTNY